MEMEYHTILIKRKNIIIGFIRFDLPTASRDPCNSCNSMIAFLGDDFLHMLELMTLPSSRSNGVISMPHVRQETCLPARLVSWDIDICKNLSLVKGKALHMREEVCFFTERLFSLREKRSSLLLNCFNNQSFPEKQISWEHFFENAFVNFWSAFFFTCSAINPGSRNVDEGKENWENQTKGFYPVRAYFGYFKPVGVEQVPHFREWNHGNVVQWSWVVFV